MPLPIETFIQATEAKLRDAAAALTILADELAGMNLAEALQMAAADIIRKLIDDDRAKTAENATLKTQVADLRAEKAQVDALATEADALLNPAPPADTGDAGAGGPTPTPPAGTVGEAAQ